MVLNNKTQAMTNTEVEKLDELAKALGIEVYHTDSEERNYYKADGTLIHREWIPKVKDVLIFRHRSLAALWGWRNKIFRSKWEQEQMKENESEVSHGS